MRPLDIHGAHARISDLEGVNDRVDPSLRIAVPRAVMAPVPHSFLSRQLQKYSLLYLVGSKPFVCSMIVECHNHSRVYTTMQLSHCINFFPI